MQIYRSFPHIPQEEVPKDVVSQGQISFGKKPSHAFEVRKEVPFALLGLQEIRKLDRAEYPFPPHIEHGETASRL